MDIDGEVIKHIELLVGSIGVIISLFFGVFLIYNRRNHQIATFFLALYLLAFSFRIGKTLFHNYFKIDPIILNIFLGMLLTIGPSAWLHSKFLYESRKEIKTNIYLHYFPFLLFLSFCWWIPNDGSTAASLFHKGLSLHMFVYIIYSLFWLTRQTEDNVSAKKKNIKSWLYYFNGLTLLLVVFFFLIMEGIIPYYIGTAIAFSIVIFLLAIRAMKNADLFRLEKEKYSGSPLKKKDTRDYFKKLDKLMKEKKPFLDHDLSLAKLAEMLALSPKELSQIINQELNCNYSQFITKYRIEHAKILLAAPADKQFKISAIAYDSGFNSLSSFNAAFKKSTKLTASEYRKSIQLP